MTTIDDLAARVAALEARPICHCDSCKRALKDAKAQRDRDRAYAILNLPPGERNDWIRVTRNSELHEAAQVWGDRMVDVALAAPADLQPQIMDCTTDTAIRARFDVLMDERRGGNPIAWVQIRAAFLHGNFGGRVSVPDIGAAEVLHLAGVRVGRDDHGFYFMTDMLMPGGYWEYRTREWQTRLAADTKIRDALAAGLLIVEDIPRDRALSLEVNARVTYVKQRYLGSRGDIEADVFPVVED